MKDIQLFKSLWPWVTFSLKVFGGIFGAFAVGLYVNQDRILYMPNPPGFPKTVDDNPQFWRNPGEWTTRGHPRKESSTSAGIPYENIYLTTADGEKIHCWLLLQPRISNNVPTLVYFHGNAGNMGFRLKNAAEMYAKANINVLMVDYRGYGENYTLQSYVFML
jgi:abhydrolase domain-containing protein 13